MLALAAVAAYAQGYRFREGSLAARYAPPHMPDAGFVVCRLAYRSVRVEPMGIGWQTDYPFAEINLTHAALGADEDPGQPESRKASRITSSCG